MIKVQGKLQHSMLLRLFGLREMASGVGLITQHQPAPWMWGRVGGDALDLACLGATLTSDDGRPGRIAAAMVAVAGVTALDVLCSQQLSQRAPQGQGRRVESSIAINCAPADLYRFWRDFQNLPRFMPHLRSVRVDTERRSYYVCMHSRIYECGRCCTGVGLVFEVSPRLLLKIQRLGSDTRFSLDYHVMLFEAAFTRSSFWVGD